MAARQNAGDAANAVGQHSNAQAFATVEDIATINLYYKFHFQNDYIYFQDDVILLLKWCYGDVMVKKSTSSYFV